MLKPKAKKKPKASQPAKETPAKRQEAFCQAFIIDLIGSHAAIAAGYSENNAAATASRMLTKANIRARIAELMDERSKRTLVDADFVVRNLLDIAMKCQSKVPVMIFDAVNKAMVQKVDADGKNVWEFDSTGANKALELLGKHLAMFTDKSKIDLDLKQMVPLFNITPIK